MRLEPINDMADAAARGFSDLPRYDVRALAEAAITAVVDHMGISTDEGASRDTIVHTVSAVAAAMHPQQPTAARRIAEWTVDWLLNADGGGRARRLTYADPSDEYRTHELDVTVLYEDRSTADGELVLKATSEAINTMLVAFDHDLADAQIAAEAVLKAHIESGKLDRASASARQAAEASRAYAVQLRQVLERTRRDVASVDWSDAVPQMLDEARTHLTARRAAEDRLRTSAEETRDQQTDPHQRATAAEIAQLVTECLHRHDVLLAELISARRVFLDEQRRQQLEVTVTATAVALTADLLTPLLLQPAKDAADVLDRFVEGAAGPLVPRKHSLALLIDQLLAPRRDRDTGPGDLSPDPTTYTVLDANVTFDVPTRQAVHDLLDGIGATVRLSEVLARCRTVGTSDDLAALVVAAAFAFGHDPRFDVDVDGTALDDLRFGGDDLRVRRRPPLEADT